MPDHDHLKPTARLINDLEAICEVERARGPSGKGRLATLQRCIRELARLGDLCAGSAQPSAPDGCKTYTVPTSQAIWMAGQKPTSE